MHCTIQENVENPHLLFHCAEKKKTDRNYHKQNPFTEYLILM